MAQPGTQFLTSTTQKYLDIADITNDLIILKDGSAAVVLKVSAINFGLLSEPEQDAIIYAYAALINSLSFVIEIVIRSQPKDVSTYLHYIDDQLKDTTSDVRRRQILSYRQYVSNLIREQNVLDKKFFVALPVSALELGIAEAVNPLTPITNRNKPVQFDKQYVIEKALNLLGPRRDHMISQFGRLGLRASALTTKELIHLFYVAYNAEASEGTEVVDTREYTSAIIQAQGNESTQAPQPSFVQQPVTSAVPQESSATTLPTAAVPTEAPNAAQTIPSVEQPAAPALTQTLATTPEAAGPAMPSVLGGAPTTANIAGETMNLGSLSAIPQESIQAPR